MAGTRKKTVPIKLDRNNRIPNEKPVIFFFNDIIIEFTINGQFLRINQNN
jgi:hypothetical protein